MSTTTGSWQPVRPNVVFHLGGRDVTLDVLSEVVTQLERAGLGGTADALIKMANDPNRDYTLRDLLRATVTVIE